MLANQARFHVAALARITSGSGAGRRRERSVHSSLGPVALAVAPASIKPTLWDGCPSERTPSPVAVISVGKGAV